MNRRAVLGLGAAGAVVLAARALAARARPLAVDDITATDVDAPVVVDVLANDSDPLGRELRVSEVQPWSDQGGVVTVHEGGLSVRYMPPQGFRGEDHFTYQVRAVE